MEQPSCNSPHGSASWVCPHWTVINGPHWNHCHSLKVTAGSKINGWRRACPACSPMLNLSPMVFEDSLLRWDIFITTSLVVNITVRIWWPSGSLPFVSILCNLVTNRRMVEFNSSICQVGHTDIGQMEDLLKLFSHLSHTSLHEQIPILPYVNEHSPIWRSTICLRSLLSDFLSDPKNLSHLHKKDE